MGTHWSGGPRDGFDEVDEGGDHVPGATRSDPNRRHVTLDNLADLADLDAPGRLTRGDRDNGSPDDDHAGHADPVDPIEAPDPDPDRAPWARPAERWLLELLAVGGASVAFVAPSVSLMSVAAGCVVGGTVAFVASGHPARTLPRRVVRRTVALLHPRSSLWAPVLLARTVLAAVVLPAGVAAAAWIIDEGTSGSMAAVRAGAWTNGFRVAAALVCFMLLTSVGDGRHRRAVAVRRWAMPATDGTLVLLAITCCAAAALAIGAVPHPTDPLASRADGLGWLPPGARADADRVRDDIVTNELAALASCLSTQTGIVWQTSYSSENAVGAPDVARLDAPPESASGVARDLPTVIVAAHNQLAPWVETIEVQLPGGRLVRTDRGSLPRGRPLTDADLLVAATSTGSQWLSGESVDRAVALRCSAGPVI